MLTRLLGKMKVGAMDSNAYDVALLPSYEDWAKANLSKSFRKELRRKRRRLDEFGKVSFEIARDDEAIQHTMTRLQAQRKERFADDLFSQEPYFNFYCQVGKAGASSGVAQTSILWVDDAPAAVEFGIVHRRCYHFLLAGFDAETFGKAAPGLIMIEEILKDRIDQGDRRADFTIGDEPYKLRFGARPNKLKHMAKSYSLLATIAHKAYDHGGWPRNWPEKSSRQDDRGQPPKAGSMDRAG